MQKIYVEVKKFHDLALIVTYLGCYLFFLLCYFVSYYMSRKRLRHFPTLTILQCVKSDIRIFGINAKTNPILEK